MKRQTRDEIEARRTQNEYRRSGPAAFEAYSEYRARRYGALASAERSEAASEGLTIRRVQVRAGLVAERDDGHPR